MESKHQVTSSIAVFIACLIWGIFPVIFFNEYIQLFEFKWWILILSPFIMIIMFMKVSTNSGFHISDWYPLFIEGFIYTGAVYTFVVYLITPFFQYSFISIVILNLITGFIILCLSKLVVGVSSYN